MQKFQPQAKLKAGLLFTTTLQLSSAVVCTKTLLQPDKTIRPHSGGRWEKEREREGREGRKFKGPIRTSLDNFGKISKFLTRTDLNPQVMQ